MDNRSLLNVKQFSAQVGHSESAVRKWIRDGMIAIVRLSPRGRVYIPEDEVRRLMTPRRVR